jgi:hypothetical protein
MSPLRGFRRWLNFFQDLAVLGYTTRPLRGKRIIP